MKRLGIALGLLVAGLLLSGDLIAADTGTINGLVKVGAVPMPGVAVKLAGPVAKSATTDAKGAFAFTGLPAGTYTLKINKPGYVQVTRRLALAAGKSLRIVIQLKARAVPKEAEEERKVAPKAEPAPAVDMLAVASSDSAAAPPPALRGRAAGGAAAVGSGKMSRRPAPKPRRRYKRRPASPPAGLVAAKPQPPRDRGTGTEQYVDHGVRQWEFTDKDNLSTFSIDVDTASYTISRRKLNEGRLPPPASVRTEEFVNYFEYAYAPPKSTKVPFAVHMEAAPSPFEKNLTLLRIGIKGYEAVGKARKPAHLTFLVDTSGSMHSQDKIGLLKKALIHLVEQLKPGDTVALCTYAGSVREILPPTGMNQKAKIIRALQNLRSGGSTAMGSGLQLAYKLAYKNFKGNSINRVIVCSDGDANVGRTKHGDMLKSIKHYAEEGVTLSTVGFGMGNYKDHRMEQLANKGNGNYYYIDTFREAKKVFGKNLMGTLQVIAKDVKIQVEFDKKAVKKYRLVGYENRDIADKDFRNDKVDAGEIGAGHTVTALYEAEVTNPRAAFATVRIRWKKPQGVKAAEKAYPFSPRMLKSSFNKTGPDFRRAVAAAALAENLRNSPFKESWTIAKAKQLAQQGLRRESKEELELIQLIDKAARLMGK